ncbi:MAG TPA: M48 family metallopeptidase [Blastocatellia bacterium]|nr:M48 family metallopeptidase [Blastocatellia bacterium]
MKKMRNRTTSIVLLAIMLAMPLGVLAQTKVVAPKNPYAVSKDVELGRQAAQEVERQLPLVNDNSVQYYVERIGRRLAESIPSEYQHSEFRYSYKAVDVSDVNAFALPGGFTYVNRGLIETAQNEGQLAGVIAHEISHVALRHGTAQAAKAQKYQAGSVAAQILGAVIGGGAGQVVGGLGQMGIGAAFLRYSRDYERQADTLGAQIMARAGYDARELANMFRILESQGGKSGPEWMSSHPNPGNRFEAINREASMLPVDNPVRDTGEFRRIQARLREMPRARSMNEASRSGGNNTRYPNDNRDSRYPDDRDSRYPNDNSRLDPRRVEYPSARFRAYTEGNLFRISVPENWREMNDGSGVTFAPEGAYGNVQGQFVFTHGVQVGTTRAESNNLQTATDRFLNGLAQGNRNLQQQGGYQRTNFGNRNGLGVTLSNISEATGRREVVSIMTTMLRNGDLFYVVFVAPQDEYNRYQNVFGQIARNIEIAN